MIRDQKVSGSWYMCFKGRYVCMQVKCKGAEAQGNKNTENPQAMVILRDYNGTELFLSFSDIVTIIM